MESYCITAAKDMLQVYVLDKDLEYKLRRAEEMVQRVKPGGFLTSTQTIATIILLWELEQTLCDRVRD